MEYFIMKFDKRVQNAFRLFDFPGSESMEYGIEDSDKLRDHTSLYTVDFDQGSYPDVIEAPLFMVSQKVKNVIELYDETTEFKAVSIINRNKKKIESYYVLLQERIDCLHEDSDFYLDNSVKELVLDSSKIGERQIFKVKGIGPAYVIVSMDIAESVLRRDSFGVLFEKVKVK